MYKNRKKREEKLTFSRAQVYLILGCIIAIAVFSFIIGRLAGGDGGGVRDETAQLQKDPLLPESEVLEEMNRLEKRLEKAAEIPPMEEPVTEEKPPGKRRSAPSENDKDSLELSFAEKLSGVLPDETEHEIKIKTVEKIERVTIIPQNKENEVKKRVRVAVASSKTDKNDRVTDVNLARLKPPPKKKTAKRPEVAEPSTAVSEATLKKPKQRVANPKYTIQVGSFPSEKSAKKLQIRLKNRGYSSYLRKVARLRAVWYRVCVGAYEKRREAEKILDRLKNKEHLEGIILNYKKP